MKAAFAVACAVVGVVVSATALANTASPYAGEQDRAIKALSPDEVAGLLAGRGMGLAKAAELNGYPGPMHVLELAQPLALSAEQRRQTEAIFQRMLAAAKDTGAQLVEAEKTLDGLFKDKTVTPERLQQALARVGELQAKLRGVHLQAHLEQTEVLRPEQTAQYTKLRGYGEAGAHNHNRGSQGHGSHPHRH